MTKLTFYLLKVVLNQSIRKAQNDSPVLYSEQFTTSSTTKSNSVASFDFKSVIYSIQAMEDSQNCTFYSVLDQNLDRLF